MSDKSFQPSKKRLADARKEGKVLKSQLVTQTVVMLVVFGAIFAIFGATWVRNQILLECTITGGYQQPLKALSNTAKLLFRVVVSGLIFGGAAGIVCEAIQVGVKFEPSSLKPKAANFDACSGLKRVAAGLKQLWLKFFSVICILLVTWWFFRSFSHLIPKMFFLPLGAKFAVFQGVLLTYAAAGCLCLLLLAILDFLVQRRKFFRELSMSHEELRREHKEAEGDMCFKAARRSQHEALLMQDIVSRVRKAKVIVVEES